MCTCIHKQLENKLFEGIMIIIAKKLNIYSKKTENVHGATMAGSVSQLGLVGLVIAR